MTTRNPRRTLISDREIDRAFQALQRHGLDPTRFGIDIRTDGIAFLAPAANTAEPESPFDAWKSRDAQNKESHRDGRPRRQKA